MENSQNNEKSKTRKIVLIALLLSLIISLLVGGGVYMWQRSERIAAEDKLQKEITSLKKSEMECVEKPDEVSEKPTICSIQKFEYEKLSFNYPCDWKLSELTKESGFPLTDRIFSEKTADKTLVLSKDGTHLVVLARTGVDGGSEGILLDEKHLQEFIENKDKISISSSEFYLSRNNVKVTDLKDAHEGPFLWATLQEYIPQRSTPSGTFKGYSDTIHRNDYAYVIFVTSDQGGKTDPVLQAEIIEILESIKW